MKKKNQLVLSIVGMILSLTVLVFIAIDSSRKIKAQKNDIEQLDNQKKLKVISTIFPSYDWVKNIAGDSVDLKLLIEDGTDFHSFEPTVSDIVNISNCDLFIYVGGESDFWVESVLKNSTNKNLKTINLIEALGSRAKVEELIEGMQEEHSHHHSHDFEDDHDHDHDADHNHDEEISYDEHVWLSIKNAKSLCNIITKTIIELDSNNKEIYLNNFFDYQKKLDLLDEEYSAKIKAAPKKTILVADRFPFRYLVDDYGLNYFAAFLGCSAESEASFKTINFLSKKVDELNLKSIFKIEDSDDKLCNTVIENSSLKNQQILILNSMQSIKKEQIKKGATYESIMKSNLEQLILGLE